MRRFCASLFWLLSSILFWGFFFQVCNLTRIFSASYTRRWNVTKRYMPSCFTKINIIVVIVWNDMPRTFPCIHAHRTLKEKKFKRKLRFFMRCFWQFGLKTCHLFLHLIVPCSICHKYCGIMTPSLYADCRMWLGVQETTSLQKNTFGSCVWCGIFPFTIN